MEAEQINFNETDPYQAKQSEPLIDLDAHNSAIRITNDNGEVLVSSKGRSSEWNSSSMPGESQEQLNQLSK